MSRKEEFVRTMHERLDRWNAEIDALMEKADSVEANARAGYEKQIEVLRGRRDEARSKLKELESAGEGAWEDLKAGVELAWDAVSEALHSAAGRFK